MWLGPEARAEFLGGGLSPSLSTTGLLFLLLCWGIFCDISNRLAIRSSVIPDHRVSSRKQSFRPQLEKDQRRQYRLMISVGLEWILDPMEAGEEGRCIPQRVSMVPFAWPEHL